MAGETRILSDFVANLKYEQLPPEVIKEAKRRIADTIACGVYSSGEITGKKISDYICSIGGSGNATVWKSGKKISTAFAVMANSAIIFHMELDDVHRFSHAHCALSVIPPALSVGEVEGSNGKQLIEAVVGGYEVINRVGRCISPSIFLDRRCMPCTVMGNLGTSAACGKLLGFDGDLLARTFGSTCFITPMAPVESYRLGTTIKEFSMGWAGYSGVMAVELAKNGFSGSPFMIESEFGFCVNACNDYDLSKITDTLGKEYEIMYAGIKPYAHCRQAHSTIDCALELRNKFGLDKLVNDIKHIQVRTFSVATRGASKEFASISAAKYSIPFAVAVSIVYGDAWIDQYVSENLTDPTIVALAQKVDTCCDPELEALYDEKWPAIVEIEMNDGQVFSARRDLMKGEPEHPLSDDELYKKFSSLTARGLQKEKAQKLWDLIFNIEKLDNVADISAELI